MQVKEVMTEEVKWVEVPGNRAEALELFKKLGASALPVVKSETGELVGMVTLRKLFEHPDEDQLAMLVDRNVPTVSPRDPLGTAAKQLLDVGGRRLPVLQDGKLVGIITVRDIVYRALATMGIERPASDFMRPCVAAIWEGTPIRATIEIMELSGSRALPVIDDKGNLVGIVDDSDLVKVSEVETSLKMSQMVGKTESDSWTWDSEDRIYITKRSLQLPEKLVKEVMTKELITITRKTSVSRCAELMKQHRIEQTPVIAAEGELIGIVRDVDLLKVLV